MRKSTQRRYMDYIIDIDTGDLIFGDDTRRIEKRTILRFEKKLSTKEIDCYNLGTGKGYSVLDLIRIFERVNNVTIKHKIVDRRNGDAPIRIADTSYAIRKLGFNPEFDIEEMCKDSYNYIKNKIENE